MRKLMILGAIVPALFLTGCGDGWEIRAYNNTPYGDRTAGAGVEYVRAVMMREKGPVIKTVEPKAEPVIVPAPVEEKPSSKIDSLIESGEKFFRDLQKK